MALRTARRLVVRGRPSVRAAGRTGATKAHARPLGRYHKSSAHRTGLFDPDQRSFKTDVNFSNTLLD